MLRNIVVGYDGLRSSQVAVEQAIELTEAMSGSLYVVNVTTVTDDELDADVPGAAEDITEFAMPTELSSEEGDTEASELIDAPLTLEEIHRRCRKLHIPSEDERLFGRRPGARLLRRSWHAELLVVGRGEERRPEAVGPNTRFLLSELVTPTLVCARQLIEPGSIMIPYRSSVSGGRGLSFAARFCERLNAELHVLVCEPGRSEAREAGDQAEQFLRAYHVESEIDISHAAPREAVHSAAIERGINLIVVPGAHKRYYLFPWQRNETLWAALEVPGTAVLGYP